MMSLPLMHRSVSEWWTHEIYVMIKKKRVVRNIHQLSIIGILEAGFNIVLKILFAKKLMYQTRQCSNLHNEQWRFSPNRTSTDTALYNMIIFEYERYRRFTLSTWERDQLSCFDRIWSEASNNVALANGLEPEQLD